MISVYPTASMPGARGQEVLPLVRLRRAALFQGRVELVSKGAGFIKTLTKDDILALFD